MVRNLVAQAEKKLNEEQTNRVSALDEIRLYFE